MPTSDALGAILAHTLTLDGGPIRKGTVLEMDHLHRIAAAGQAMLIAAKLEPGDLSEDAAARQIGAGLASPGLRLGEGHTGRINLVAQTAGVLRVDVARVAAMNAVDEGLTLATLPDLTRVAPDRLVATVKVIPYGLAEVVVARGGLALGPEPIRLMPFRGGVARLIMTRTPGFKESLLAKGEAVVRDRVEALGYSLGTVDVVAHEETEVAAALADTGDLVLILGASATSDRADVAPAGVVRAGGRIDRFGMPVDPGNLLFLGAIGNVPVVGLPGCARSPALNGVDWVLERIAAGIEVDSAAIAEMGAGGLLKEMTGRPQPRRPAG